MTQELFTFLVLSKTLTVFVSEDGRIWALNTEDLNIAPFEITMEWYEHAVNVFNNRVWN